MAERLLEAQGEEDDAEDHGHVEVRVQVARERDRGISNFLLPRFAWL